MQTHVVQLEGRTVDHFLIQFRKSLIWNWLEKMYFTLKLVHLTFLLKLSLVAPWGRKTKNNSFYGRGRVFDNFLLLHGKYWILSTSFSKSIFMNFIQIFFCIICNTYICCWTTEELRSSGKLTHHYAKLKLCFTTNVAIHVSAFLKIQFSSFELPNWSIVNGTREFYMRMITL